MGRENYIEHSQLLWVYTETTGGNKRYVPRSRRLFRGALGKTAVEIVRTAVHMYNTPYVSYIHDAAG